MTDAETYLTEVDRVLRAARGAAAPRLSAELTLWLGKLRADETGVAAANRRRADGSSPGGAGSAGISSTASTAGAARRAGAAIAWRVRYFDIWRDTWPSDSLTPLASAPVAGWGSDEFVLRLNELRALLVSLFIMGGIAVAAFVACAVL